MRRPSQPRDIPPPLELECLKALWGLGQGSVREVREMISNKHDLAYTTVMTLLERLEKRGGATRRRQGRHFVYTPLVSREKLVGCAVKELVDTFFDGSQNDLLAYLKERSLTASGS